jgi:hypothetical protein
MEGLRKASIRNSFDLLAAQENDCLDKVAELSGIEAEQLSIVCKILSEDPKTESLKTMRKQLSEDQFYLDLIGGSESPDNESGDESSGAGIH